MKKHFLVLDSFRGICACLVAISHFNANSILSGHALFDHGGIYVNFFFVLSGFIIFANYEEKLRAGYSLGKFMFLRFFRLWPLHIVVLLAFVFTDLLQLFLHIDGASVNPPFQGEGESIPEIMLNAGLLHGFFQFAPYALNGPSWSISIELWTYLFFAILLLYLGRAYKPVIAVITAVSGLILFILSGDIHGEAFLSFLRCVFSFGVGGFTWYAYQHYAQQEATRTKSFSKDTGLEIVILVGTLVFVSAFTLHALSILTPFFFAVLIFVFAKERGLLSKLFLLRPFVFVGMLSYSIYMIHVFISGKLFALPVRLLSAKAGIDLTLVQDGIVKYGTNIWMGSAIEIAFLVIVIGCSYISFRMIEEPFRKWSKSYLKRKETL
jgi:peptidoglycan/LPS O-acetylase OafA/YrhL